MMKRALLLVGLGILLAQCQIWEKLSEQKGRKETALVPLAYEQHIKKIVDQKCGFCHLEGGIGPFALETYAQVTDKAEKALEAIEARRMPPWPAKRDCRPYHGDYSLTEEEKGMFRSWVKAGMPESLPGETVYQPQPLERLELSRVDLRLKNSQPYKPKPFPDDTRCFVIDWPYQDVKYITGNDVVPGDTSLVHHVSIYMGSAQDRAFYQELDALNDDPGDGYPCSATMGVGKSSARWIGGWLPGISGFEYPLNAGMRVEPNSVLIMQVHYYKGVKPGSKPDPNIKIAPDQTEVLFKIDDAVDLIGTLVTFTNPDWMVELEMEIPAGKKSVRHEFVGQLDLIPSLIGQEFPLKGNTFDIQSINMHGHALMSAARMKIIRADQSEECLLNIEDFQSKYQLNYMFERPAAINPGDKVYLSCEWDNSAENQMLIDGQRLDPIDVNWGDGARQEMCFGLMFVTERAP